ncbi:MAG TPA: NAD-dependent epimerase/dehydratase family protein [Candidatus Angelobacter sp.]|nr:NAD-dependent epimerase/dehydratase family protein [Candidatus Angelobacter sp.]
MRVLVVGGTRFVGRHIVEAALGGGHDVTLLHRGSAPDDLFPDAEHLHTDRDGDLSLLAGREFDATVDVTAYLPRQVRALAHALDGRGGRYLVISSTSVYAAPAGPGFDESSPTVEPAGPGVDVVTAETYGPLKVAVEREARDLFGPGATVVRPTYVIGPWDQTRRFTSWVQRIARGGEVLAPGTPADPIQVIDARDLGSFCVRLVADDVAGTFHAVSPEPPYSFADLLGDVAAVVAPPGTTLTWVDEGWLLERGESDATIPLWGGGDPWVEANAASPAAARAAGLPVRPVRQSVAELAEHLRREPLEMPGPGMSPQRESALLADWHGR